MRADVRGMYGVPSIVFVLPRVLDCIQTANLKTPSEESVRQMKKDVTGATSDYRSRFRKTPKKFCFVRIPRDTFTDDLLKELDKGKPSGVKGFFTCVSVHTYIFFTIY